MSRTRTAIPLYLTFLVPILLTVLITSTTVMTILIRREEARLQMGLRDKGETLARHLAASAEFGVRVHDRESLQDLTEMLLTVREITLAEVRNKEGAILARSVKEGVAGADSPMVVSAPVTTRRVERRKEEIGIGGEEATARPPGRGPGEESFLDVEAAADTTSAEEIGAVVLSLATVEVEAAVARARATVVGMTAVSVLILSGVLAVLVRFITSPVKRLVAATNHIAAGDLTRTVEPPRGDELGELAASFNQMVAALRRSMDELHRTSEFSQAMIPPAGPDELLAVILDRFRAFPGLHRVGIFLTAPGGDALDFAAGDEVFRGLSIPAGEARSGSLPEGESILLLDPGEDWRGSLAARGGEVAVPLRSKETLVGMVAAGPRGGLDAGEGELFRTLAAIAGMAIENMRLDAVRTENEILRRELAFAHEIQMRLLPGGVPELSGLSIHPFCLPARELGGDFYDFLPLDGGRRLGVTVADVAGKGVPAALFMASSRSYLRAEAVKHPTPGQVLTNINRLLHDDMKNKSFVSMFYGVYDPGQRVLEYANAGHLFPLLVRHGTGGSCYLKAPGLPLGISAQVAYGTETVRLEPGDLIVYYTDGLVEAMNPERELFGFERLEQVTGTLGDREPREVVDTLLDEVTSFTRGVPFRDDLTLIAVRIA
jgi:serine phosphatase RsbU (regulator of sigma subunit)/HAMP domain-containing protein